MEYNKLCDVQLWQLIASGDRSAFGFVFSSYSKDLFRYGQKFTRDKALIEDMVQDTFMGLWNSKEKTKIDKSIKFYLITAFRRELIRRLNTSRRVDNIENCSEELFMQVSHLEEMQQEQALKRVNEDLHLAIGGLTPRQKEAIYLKYFVELSYEEIAETLEMQVPSLYNLVLKAMKSLKKSLATETLFSNVK